MNEKTYTVVYMTVVCAVATALMTGAKVTLDSRIKANETFQTNRNLLSGLGLSPATVAPMVINSIYVNQIEQKTINGHRFYYAYETAEKRILKSIGIEYEGPGFWGPIRLLISLDPKGETIVGIVFLKEQETPGLGARMEEPAFKSQFIGKEAAQYDANGAYLYFRPEGTTGNGPREVNGITGATRTSDSLRSIINKALKAFHESIGKDAAEAENTPSPAKRL